MSPARLARIAYLDLEGSVLHPVNGTGDTGNVRPGLNPLAQEQQRTSGRQTPQGVRLAEWESARDDASSTALHMGDKGVVRLDSCRHRGKGRGLVAGPRNSVRSTAYL
jgi:hypothetical protein